MTEIMLHFVLGDKQCHILCSAVCTCVAVRHAFSEALNTNRSPVSGQWSVVTASVSQCFQCVMRAR